jgi:hypothetical protein
VLLDVRHWPVASQQPLGHDVASHTHLPCALQRWFALHATHWPPLTPQLVFDEAWHTPFEQQPAQLVLPQLHAPLLHVCPVEHVPHALPDAPHAAAVCPAWATQRFCASQHPPGHDAGVHTHAPVLLHTCPVAHAPHAAPRAPHAAALSDAYATHVLPLQQPFGHDAASHTHLPAALHSWPAPHAAHAAPATPQVVFVDVTHTPALEQHPDAHEVAPHVHAPLAHACPAAHAAQRTPPVPHSLGVVAVTHWSFESQHPPAHVVALHLGPTTPPSSPASTSGGPPSSSPPSTPTVPSPELPPAFAPDTPGAPLPLVPPLAWPLPPTPLLPLLPTTDTSAPASAKSCRPLPTIRLQPPPPARPMAVASTKRSSFFKICAPITAPPEAENVASVLEPSQVEGSK